MNRFAISIVGGLMGLSTGALFVRPVTAFFAATPIMWDAQNCPAGIYSITALARTQSTTQTYAVTSRDVSLPKASITQQFSDLPPGSYQVSATVIGDNGKSFQSETQTVIGQGGGGSTILGQNRSLVRVPAGSARPRHAPEPTPPPRPPNDPRLSPPVGDSATRSTIAALRRPVRPLVADVTLDAILQRLLGQWEMESGPDASDQIWRRVAAVDTDGDGSVDTISIESITGDIRVYRIVR